MSEKYKNVWAKSYANELGRLTQGIRDIPRTNTMFFINKSDVPADRCKDITYGRIVVTLRRQKSEKERTRLTVGGNLIDYPWEVTTPTADLTTAKLLFNSVISTPKAVFVVMDCKNFYLMTPMLRPEFMGLNMQLIPDEIIEKYNLKEKVDGKGWIYIVWPSSSWPSCKQTLGKMPRPRRVLPVSVHSPIGLSHVKHLKAALEKYYEVTVDWKGELFCGITLHWDYTNRTVNLSMPYYIPKTLKRFQHSPPSRPQHALYKCAPIQYGNRVQLAQDDKTSPEHSPPLSPDKIKHIQQIVGMLLY